MFAASKFVDISPAVWRIRDVYPGSRILILPIPDPKTATKERGEKKILSFLFI
jgi:hypothetical protein